jgi:hypothetical protein
MLEDARNRGMELAGNFGLCTPNGRKHGSHVDRCDFMHRPSEQRPGIRGAEMTLPLIADLGIGRFALGVGDKRPDGPFRLAQTLSGIERIDAARDQLAGISAAMRASDRPTEG